MNQNDLINKVIHADSRRFLKKMPDNLVNLVYLDPPFFTDRIFKLKTEDGMISSFSDRWGRHIQNYLDFMIPILTECQRILKKTGSLYLHCDHHASHYLKIELDRIFGLQNFRNQIIWKRHNSHNDWRQGCKLFGRVHDVILFYSKTKNYTWNPIYRPYSDEHIKKYYNQVESETGRRFAYGDLSGPGGAMKGNPSYEFLGVTRHWRFSKDRMMRLYKEGRIVQRKKGNVPVQKRYLDEMLGFFYQDLWLDIKSAQITKKELVNYPTQKPLQLLERIIETSSNPGDIVLDAFSGSGTTLLASKNLLRYFIGIDSNKTACQISKNRLKMSKANPSMKIVSSIRVTKN